MRTEIVERPLLARHAANRIATLLDQAVSERGIASLAVSGGSTPAAMFAELAQLRVPWEKVHLFQVDERIAPDDHGDRNYGDLTEHLVNALPTTLGGFHPMPVGAIAPDLDSGAESTASEGDADQPLLDANVTDAVAAEYAKTLESVTGTPAVLDVVHLGLGDDGHTASLAPGDPVLTVEDRDVAVSAIYKRRQRLTLTYPALKRARELVWLVAGADKTEAVCQLLASDPAIPAGRIPHDTSVLLLDPDAAAGLR